MQQSTTFIDTGKANRWFFIFCLLQLVFWTIEPTLARHNLPFDSVEGIAWGNMWLWGYEKHPPLAAWLTAIFTKFSGTVGWPIYFLSQLAVVTCFWAMWQIAKKILPPWHALISIVLLTGIYYYNIASAQFNPNILMLPTWALTAFSFYYALLQQKNWQWLLVGICAGLAMLTKYEALLLFVPMFAVLLFTNEGKKSFTRIGFYLGIVVAVLIWLPNLIWLAQHDFTPLTYASTRMSSNTLKHVPHWINHFYQPVRFLFEQFCAIIPVLILLLPFYRSPKIQLQISEFNWRFLIIMGLGPLACTATISLVSGLWIHSLWAFSFLSFVGILAMAWLRPQITAENSRQFTYLAASLAAGLLIFRSLFLLYGPYISHHTTASDFPGQQISTVVTQQWHDLYHQRLTYIAGDHSVTINVSGYSPDHPTPYYFSDNPDEVSPWINEADVKAKGGVFVMRVKDNSATNALVQKMLQQYPGIKYQRIQIFYLQTDAKFPPLHLWIGILPPAGK